MGAKQFLRDSANVRDVKKGDILPQLLMHMEHQLKMHQNYMLLLKSQLPMHLSWTTLILPLLDQMLTTPTLLLLPLKISLLKLMPLLTAMQLKKSLADMMSSILLPAMLEVEKKPTPSKCS